MKLQIGQSIFGKDLDEIYTEIFKIFNTPTNYSALYQLIKNYSSSAVTKKDIDCIDILLKNTSNLKKIAIVGGNFPITYLVKIHKQYPNIEFVIIDEGYFISFLEDYLKTKFNLNIIKLNPLFDDISEHILDVDLIIYPETELLVPFNMLKYKNTKLIFAVNFFYVDYKLNINQAYSAEDLEDLCCIQNSIKGHVEVNGKKAYYVLGKPYDN